MLEALGIDFKEIIFAIINFLILVGVLYKFLYNPFLGMLEKRKQTIQDQFDSAENEKKRAAAMMAKYKRQIANVEEEGRTIIADAKVVADEQAKLIIEAANKEAEEIKAKAMRDIELEKAKAEADMQEQIGMLAMLAAEKIVEREVDNIGHETIVDEVIKNARDASWQN